KGKQEIKIPKFTVKYNEESAKNLHYAVVISPSFDIEYVKDNKFTPKQSGVYTVRYFAIDLYGNTEILDFEITVYK
ncbi:MAG: hypothetical protein IJV99_01420, partial [Clostridia bacterium]|nr:hypothetical protein [Clostridia bacterium]